MTTVTRHFHWPMGHRLQRHEGGCRFPHGHSYEAEVTVAGELSSAGPDAGMVMDFAALDAAVRSVVDGWDHAFMVEESDPFHDVLEAWEATVPGDQPRVTKVVVVPVPPTAEHIAALLFHEVQGRLQPQWRVVQVRVHEGPKSVATYEEEWA